MKRLIPIFIALGICACVTTYPSLNEIDSFDSPDQKILYGMIGTLQSSLNARAVDEWFALYTDDAIITYVKNRPTPKKEVVALVREKGTGMWKFRIVDVKMKDCAITGDRAVVKAVLKMDTGEYVKDHPETYYFTKAFGQWLIEKETNP